MSETVKPSVCGCSECQRMRANRAAVTRGEEKQLNRRDAVDHLVDMGRLTGADLRAWANRLGFTWPDPGCVVLAARRLGGGTGAEFQAALASDAVLPLWLDEALTAALRREALGRLAEG